MEPTKTTEPVISIGDVIEAGAMFPGLCDEPIVWEVKEIAHAGALHLAMSYMETYVGTAVGSIVNGKLVIKGRLK